MGWKTSLLHSFDLFGQRIGLRYKKDNTYHTMTGSIISLLIFVAFLAIFIQNLLLTIYKTQIYSRITAKQVENPTSINIPTKDFMFAVGIDGLDLNSPKKYFNLTLQNRYKSKTLSNIISIKLVQCNVNDWNKFNPNFTQTFARIGLSQWLCPSPDTIIELEGKFTSDMFKYIKIAVKTCDRSNKQGVICANQSQLTSFLDGFQQRNFKFYFINNLINTNFEEYVEKYLQDKNYYPFNTKQGVTANLFLNDYETFTDQSISFTESIKRQKGWVVTDNAQIIYRIPTDEYLSFYIRKASKSFTIQRSYLKISETISFLGGLFSFIIIATTIMNIYTQNSFEIEICSLLFTESENWHQKNRLNFLEFIGLLMYKFIRIFKKDVNWLRMEKYFNRQKQINYQMDIVMIIKKILFLEKAVQLFFTKQQYFGLHLQNDLTIQHAEKNRKQYTFFKKIKEVCNEQSEQDQNEKQKENHKNQNQQEAKKDKLKRKQTTEIQPKFKITNAFLKSIRTGIFEKQMKKSNIQIKKKIKSKQKDQISSQRQLYFAEHIDPNNFHFDDFDREFDKMIIEDKIINIMANNLQKLKSINLKNNLSELNQRLWFALNPQIKIITEKATNHMNKSSHIPINNYISENQNNEELVIRSSKSSSNPFQYPVK